MRLATASDVVTTMGIASNSGSLENAKRALDLSYPIIENILETRFISGSYTDFFDVASGATQFRLSNIFVDTDTLEVRQSSDGSPLFAYGEGTLVAGSDYHYNATTGVITFRTTPKLGRHTISVSYDFGFSEDDGELDQDAVPYWLKETAISMAVLVLNTYVSSPANRKDKTVVNVADSLFALASRMLMPKVRPRLCVEFPSRFIDRG